MCIEEITTTEIITDGKTTLTTSNGGLPYSSLPIEISFLSTNEVTFNVLQTWSSGGYIGWIAVNRFVQDLGYVCTMMSNIHSSEKFEYTASCDGNYAEVDLYVHDESFPVADVTVPSRCGPLTDGGTTAVFSFTIPCQGTSETEKTTNEVHCPTSTPSSASPAGYPTSTPADIPTLPPTLSPISGGLCIEEVTTIETHTTGAATLSESNGGSNTMYNSIPLEIVSADAEWVRFNVLQEWKLNESVGWIATQRIDPDSENLVCTKVNEVQSSQKFEFMAECSNGVAEVRLFVYDSSFDESDGTSVPSMCLPSNNQRQTAYFKFDIPCLDTSTEPTRTTTTTPVQCPTDVLEIETSHSVKLRSSANTDTGCVDHKQITYEDFERGADGSSNVVGWSTPSNVYFDSFGYFLGRFGHENSETHKVYQIPTGADYLILEFDFLEIDQWESCDEAFVVIEGTIKKSVSMGCFSVGETTANNEYSAVDTGIQISRSKKGNSDYVDYTNTGQAHYVTVSIPSSYFSVLPALKIGFEFTMSDDINTMSAGIDNLRLTAHGLCSSEPVSAPTKEPTRPPTAPPSFAMAAACVEEQRVAIEEFDYDDGSWTNMAISSFGTYGNFLGRYGQGFDSTRKEFAVPADAETLTLEFVFYAIDEWEDDDQVKVQIGTTIIDLGQFCEKFATQNPFYSGEVDGIAFERNAVAPPSQIAFGSANDQIFTVKLTIPPSKYSNGVLAIGFSVSMNSVLPNESAGFDKLMITAHFDCSSSSASSSNGPTGRRGQSCEDVVISNDANDASDAWEHSTYSSIGNYNILGRYGKDSELPSREFTVPTDADEIKIEFLFFEIDEWEVRDRVSVVINDAYISMGRMNKNKESDFYENIETEGIQLNRVKHTEPYNIDSNKYDGQIHMVKITIQPALYVKLGKVTVGFHAIFGSGINDVSFGVSNFKITAIGSCALYRRDLLTSTQQQQQQQEGVVSPIQNVVAGEPDMNGDDGEEGSYCLAEDFPCNGGDMVYVCHYSTRHGYQTFCIPESDSEILRFYSKDYCGPCVGGYGGLNWS